MSENSEQIPNSDALELEISKLKEEIKNLEYSNWWVNRSLQSLSFITTLLAVAGFGFGIYSFHYQQQKDNDNRIKDNEKQTLEIQRVDRTFIEKINEIEKQNRAKFHEKQLDVFYNLSEIAAKTAVEKDLNKREILFQNFLELYYGKFVIADYDNDLKEKVDEFKNSYQNNSLDQSKLKTSANNLSVACRNWIKTFWGLKANNDFKNMK